MSIVERKIYWGVFFHFPPLYLKCITCVCVCAHAHVQFLYIVYYDIMTCARHWASLVLFVDHAYWKSDLSPGASWLHGP